MNSQSAILDTECIGWLVEFNSLTEQEVIHDVHLNTDFFIGRNPTRCAVVVNESTVSSRHLRIYCIGYFLDDEVTSNVAPLVYALDVSRNGTILRSKNESGQRLLNNDHRAVLLNDKDQLHVSTSTSFMFCPYRQEESGELPNEDEEEAYTSNVLSVAPRELGPLSTKYTISPRLLGEGTFGKVYLTYNHQSGLQVACKVVNSVERSTVVLVDRFQAEVSDTSLLGVLTSLVSNPAKKKVGSKVSQELYLKRLEREIGILQILDHPNVIKVESILRTCSHVYIFQELVTAGDLFSYLEYCGGRLRGSTTAAIVRQILKAVEYLHDQDLVHRDLKPENILMTSIDEGARVVITDFGHARYIPNRAENPNSRPRRMFSVAGTLGFSAPELPLAWGQQDEKSHGYSKAVDMFSIGAITAMLLTGEPLNPNRHAHTSAIPLMDIADPAQWRGVGKRARRFVQQLLVMDEHSRLTVQAALEHSWFTNAVHAAEFEALYDRSLKGWQPRCAPVEVLEITTEVPVEAADDVPFAKSPWFEERKELHSTARSFPGQPTAATPKSPANMRISSAPPVSLSRRFSFGAEDIEDETFSDKDGLDVKVERNYVEDTILVPSSQEDTQKFTSATLFDKAGRPNVILPPPGRETFYFGPHPTPPTSPLRTGSFIGPQAASTKRKSSAVSSVADFDRPHFSKRARSKSVARNSLGSTGERFVIYTDADAVV